eukprot:1143934-Pelagomonas_calceolata.AAC.3
MTACLQLLAPHGYMGCRKGVQMSRMGLGQGAFRNGAWVMEAVTQTQGGKRPGAAGGKGK